jgi:hypothetical protein
MQTWAKRGLQTALVTGGLLMLGTGIASADENVNPDVPAGPLDLNVTVPVDIAENAVGTPIGQVNLPGYRGELSTKPVTAPAKRALAPLSGHAKPVTAAAAPVTGAAAKVAGVATRVAETGARGTDAFGELTQPSMTASNDPFKGNKVSGDLTAPIQITGNALGVAGDSEVQGSDHSQSYSHDQDVQTDGSDSAAAGNTVVLDWALPVQISGNAGGLAGGSGRTSGNASQSTSETGNVSTDGRNAGTSGNVVAGQFATPVQVTGNAASWILGNASSDFISSTDATSGGSVESAGDGSSTSGNVVGAPIALPVKLNGNAASAWGSNAKSTSSSTADATAGSTFSGLNDEPSYLATSGDDSFASGNVLSPQGGLIANVAGNAATWIGNAATGNGVGDRSSVASSTGTSSSTLVSGGRTTTTGVDSAGSGNNATVPLALPAEVFGVGASYIGNAKADHDNTTDVTAGDGGTRTNGDGGFLAGNTATTPGSVTAELFGIAGSHIGNSAAAASEEKNLKTGGYNGTKGDESAGSGNLVEVPLAVPVELFGIGGSFIGQGVATADEVKTVEAGGDGNTNDDDAFVSSNLVATPISAPVQAFGIGGSFIGRGSGAASTQTTSDAGGDAKASGKGAGASGNLVTTPVSLPTQLHGIGGSFIGTGSGASENLTDSVAGGTNTTNGADGGLAGNVVEVPVGAAAGVFGDGAALVGLGHGKSANQVSSGAGGSTETDGDRGVLAGNVVAAQAMPVAQVFGDAVSAIAKTSGLSSNTTSTTSGGDITTSGVDGAFSGDILDVPAAAVVQVFGDAVAVLGVADAAADNVTYGQNAGTDTTAGSMRSLSGFTGQLPIGALVHVFDVPLELIGVASTHASDDTVVSNANKEVQLNLPIDGAELPATELPTLPSSLPTPADLPALAKALPALPKVLPAPVAQRADVPAIASVDSNPLNLVQRVVSELNGKNIHIQ